MTAVSAVIYRDFVAKLMYKDGVQMPLSYIALGLAGETAELYTQLSARDGTNKAGIEDESGDVLWYTQAMAVSLGVDLFGADLLGVDKALYIKYGNPSLTQVVGLICEAVKKHAWHGKPLNVPYVTELLQVSRMILAHDAEQYGNGFVSVMVSNMEKLKSRYPGGFVEGGGIR